MAGRPTEFWLLLAMVLLVAGLNIAFVLAYGISFLTVGIILGVNVVLSPVAKRVMRGWT